jgi:hypothetical protein
LSKAFKSKLRKRSRSTSSLARVFAVTGFRFALGFRRTFVGTVEE